MDKLKQISDWIISQGAEITRDVLEEKLKEAYDQGRLDMYNEQVDDTLDNILFNTKRNINIEKKKLQEKNFYNKPSEEDVIKMRAYEYLNENLGEIIKNYKEN
ncbi:hypothetical protein NSA56_04110 [Oceanobacillus caeni]|uniref:hypothetical protein n=1 Tax=Oceanobacillus caeni TaxID=405946 RepID=UPI00214A3A4F|nr:hypothetical protein [Oceanobacillus caeni]MCR1833579.1 hypothetical protein [Oceanobacillus caeni]